MIYLLAYLWIGTLISLVNFWKQKLACWNSTRILCALIWPLWFVPFSKRLYDKAWSMPK